MKEHSSDSQKKETIKARARSLGFSFCGVTSAASLAEFHRFENWLSQGHQGSISYLASSRHIFARKDPAGLVPWVKSILVLGWSYGLNRAPAAEARGQVAGYAVMRDYHIFLPALLRELTEVLPSLFERPVQSSIFCDSAPILERELAVRSGAGWIGKNSCLIHPEHGSAILLAEIFLDCELPPDPPYASEHCGSCQRCIDACPTHCILPDRTIDASHCIAAFTIEQKGPFLSEIGGQVENHLFGCDVCQVVCPWNRKKAAADPNAASLSIDQMKSLLSLNGEEFSSHFDSTVFSRLKRRGLVRNSCAVLGNLHASSAWPELEQVLMHDTEPDCRIAAAQAMLSLDAQAARPMIAQALVGIPPIKLPDELSSLLE